MLRLATVGLLLLLAGCAEAAGAVAGAVVNTAIAVSASAVSRSQGGCYAACPTGTRCNGETGMCDALPCHNMCHSDEMCEEQGTVERCVPRHATDLQIELKPARITPQ
jgi:hypothetical protein